MEAMSSSSEIIFVSKFCSSSVNSVDKSVVAICTMELRRSTKLKSSIASRKVINRISCLVVTAPLETNASLKSELKMQQEADIIAAFIVMSVTIVLNTVKSDSRLPPNSVNELDSFSFVFAMVRNVSIAVTNAFQYMDIAVANRSNS